VIYGALSAGAPASAGGGDYSAPAVVAECPRNRALTGALGRSTLSGEAQWIPRGDTNHRRLSVLVEGRTITANRPACAQESVAQGRIANLRLAKTLKLGLFFRIKA